MVDGYETYALILTLVASMPALLPPEDHARIPFFSGTTSAETLLGFGVGGVFGGVLADAYGRRRTMLVTVCHLLRGGFVLTPVVFLWPHSLPGLLVLPAVNDLFTMGQYSWMPVWLSVLSDSHACDWNRVGIQRGSRRYAS